MALSRSRRDSGMNYWPGFVDALSTLILSIIFLLTVFMVAQFFLSQEVSGKDTALARLTAQISRLSDLLSLERAGKTSLEDEISRLRASLSSVEGERDRLRGLASASQAAANDKAEFGKLNSQIDLEKAATARAVAQIEILNQQITALRRQIAALEEALGTSEQKEKESQLRITDLGQRLNVALAQRVQELSRYRSDFFGKLREILAPAPTSHRRRPLRVPVGGVPDSGGAAVLRPEARAELDQVASTASSKKILRGSTGCCVGSHTDARPLTELAVQVEQSCPARAISVVQYRSAGASHRAFGGGRLRRVPADRSRSH
jgi:chemotaxis protein MotB